MSVNLVYYFCQRSLEHEHQVAFSFNLSIITERTELFLTEGTLVNRHCTATCYRHIYSFSPKGPDFYPAC